MSNDSRKTWIDIDGILTRWVKHKLSASNLVDDYIGLQLQTVACTWKGYSTHRVLS